MPHITKTCTYTFSREEVQALLLEVIKKESLDKSISVSNPNFIFNVSSYGEDFQNVEVTVHEAEHSGMYDR